jgi:hypothetical protein
MESKPFGSGLDGSRRVSLHDASRSPLLYSAKRTDFATTDSALKHAS